MHRIISKKPVAKFRYKGSHSHPVRVTILVIENKSNLLTGYVLRSGSAVFSMNEAPIRSYRKDRIAKFGDYCRLKMSRKTYSKCNYESTLQRLSLLDLSKNGI